MLFHINFRLQAAIFDFSLTPTNQSSRVAWHRKHRYNCYNCVAIICTSWDIRYFLFTSGSRPPYLIFHPHWRRPELIFVELCCSMQKICGFRWNFTHIPSAVSGLSVSGFTSAILIYGWTRIELCTGRGCYQQRWLRHPQKQTQQRWICFQR